MKAFRAAGTGGSAVADTPRRAALAFFDKHPSKRKCDVIEGEQDGAFFTVAYGRPWPLSWKDVTKKTVGELPDQE